MSLTNTQSRCIVCGKHSDAAVGQFCDTHYDGWRKSHEYANKIRPERFRIADYVMRVQGEERNGRKLEVKT